MRRVSCKLPRNSAETTCTTSPEQIEVMKLEGYTGPLCNKHVHSTVTRSSPFYCPVGVINKPTTVELWISPVYRLLAVAKFSKSTRGPSAIAELRVCLGVSTLYSSAILLMLKMACLKYLLITSGAFGCNDCGENSLDVAILTYAEEYVKSVNSDTFPELLVVAAVFNVYLFRNSQLSTLYSTVKSRTEMTIITTVRYSG